MIYCSTPCFIIYLVCLLFTKCSALDDGGFGTQYIWTSLEEGLQQAKTENKPLMLIIHKSWCGACKALKPQFSSSLQIENLSRHFIMVNAGDDDEPKEKIYAPDGSYVPRIFFLNSSGDVQEDIFNEQGNPNYKFYYFNADTIVTAMKGAVKKLITSKSSTQDEL